MTILYRILGESFQREDKDHVSLYPGVVKLVKQQLHELGWYEAIRIGLYFVGMLHKINQLKGKILISVMA